MTSVDVVADILGGPLIVELWPLARDDDRWVIASALTGPVADIDLRRPYLHNIRLVGSSMHTASGDRPIMMHLRALHDAA